MSRQPESALGLVVLTGRCRVPEWHALVPAEGGAVGPRSVLCAVFCVVNRYPGTSRTSTTIYQPLSVGNSYYCATTRTDQSVPKYLVRVRTSFHSAKRGWRSVVNVLKLQFLRVMIRDIYVRIQSRTSLVAPHSKALVSLPRGNMHVPSSSHAPGTSLPY